MTSADGGTQFWVCNNIVSHIQHPAHYHTNTHTEVVLPQRRTGESAHWKTFCSQLSDLCHCHRHNDAQHHPGPNSRPPTSRQPALIHQQPGKLHTGSKNRAVTKIEAMNSKTSMIISLHKNGDFSHWGSEGNQIRVLVLGVSAHWVVQVLFPLLKLVNRAKKVIYETIIVPYAQHIDNSHHGPDLVSQDTEFISCGFYFHKWKCQMLLHNGHMKLWEFLWWLFLWWIHQPVKTGSNKVILGGKKDIELVEMNKTSIKTTQRTVWEEKQGVKFSSCDVSGSFICCLSFIAFCDFMTKHNLQMRWVFSWNVMMCTTQTQYKLLNTQLDIIGDKSSSVHISENVF